MTIEELTAALEKAQASIAKLETKNSELIDREKKAKEAADAAETAREEAASAAAAKAGDVEAIKAQLQRKHDAELKKLNDQLSTMSGELSTLKIDNVISAEIAKAGVLPHHADILATFLKSGVKMENGEALKDGVSLADHLSGFFSSDAAKHYIAAPNNAGAGATGATAAAGNAPIKDVGAFMKLAKENPEAAKAANVDPSIAYLKNAL